MDMSLLQSTDMYPYTCKVFSTREYLHYVCMYHICSKRDNLVILRAGQIFEIFKCFKCFKKYLKNVSGNGSFCSIEIFEKYLKYLLNYLKYLKYL